ncbi:MAG: hypothetical protein D4R45_02155 [Planctomycetaceae bacterium]|nr:MAG: hypothetical protein D4R45_02155 [Planctomycetaceae bacterium]
MESTRKWKKAGFSTMLWAVIAAVLCAAPPIQANVTVPAGEEWDINYDVDGVLSVYGTANLDTGAYAGYGIYAFDGSAVNIRGGNVGPGFFVAVFTGPPAAVVTVYGTDFAVDTGTIEDGSWTPGGGSGTLTGEYENGDPINLLFLSDVPILLAPPGTTNLPPMAIAGQEGLIGSGGKIHPIDSSEQDTTIVLGQASDPEDEPIEYRWLEGETVLLDWTAVSTPPQAYLDLSTLDPFSAGDHTLTLEVRETTGELLEASDTMTLRILAAPEITEITIEPTPLGSPTTVTAMFSDADGGTHTATIVWEEGGTPESGVVNESEMSVTGSHTYTTTGVYTVTVTVTDQNGGDASSTAYAAVYDPESCNLVTGAGWFPEEGGPCDKAFFGFVIRQWAGGDPVGRMRFRWGDNKFRATEFDWLVISDDENSAWFFGVGNINGTGEYYFMVEISENPDSIWVTIWDEYDNEGLIEITRGRIKIRQWGG